MHCAVLLITDAADQIVYEIDIATGKKKFAGTDATIFIKMFGTTGVGRELEFKDDNGRRFEKGSIDHFRVSYHSLCRLISVIQ